MPASPPPPVTPDGRYIVVRGRLWRCSDPTLRQFERQALVDALMRARRDVRDAGRGGDADALRNARARVDAAKQGLGERGPVWWNDGAPDENRRMAKNSSYADWWRAVEQDGDQGMTNYRAERLEWDDEVLGAIDLPGGRLRMTRGVGSGLASRAGDPPGVFWALGDRGPNCKVKVATKRYGVDALRHLVEMDGAKIMPLLEHGPALARLRVDGGRVVRETLLPVRDASGRPVGGLPVPASSAAEDEPIYGLDGAALGTDPSGVDSEGVAALADGGFWIGDEYGPSLLRLDAEGRVVVRWTPDGCAHLFAGAAYPVADALPALAAARRLNRGFEAIALSSDERRLLLAFQSPLAHPDRDAHETSRNVRIWRIDARTGALDAEWAYRLEPAAAFRRDMAEGDFEQKDVKVSEMVMLGGDAVLILERGSKSTKLYRVELVPELATPLSLRDPATRPTLEQMDDAALAAAGVAPLPKTLILDTDDVPELPADLEGAVVLSPTELLLVNDNDFGVEGVETEFWRVTFDAPLA